MMRGLLTVLSKEVRDNFRDRRTVMSAFSLSLLGPALFIGMMTFVLNRAVGESDEPVELTVVGAEYAPGLIKFLETQNTTLEFIETEDARQEIIADRHDLILLIKEDFSERFRLGEINAVSLLRDSSEFGSSRRDFSTARNMINLYARTIGVLRLQLRGIDPTVSQPIIVQEIDTASPAARALTVLATLPYLLTLVIFMGGFYLAIDATAGEREHGSLEPLLTQPISRTQLVLGKILAASAFSAISLCLFLASFSVTIPFVPLHKVGMSMEMGLVPAVRIFLTAIPLMIFGAGLLTAMASFAKSYKEAQTYLTMVIMVPTLPLIAIQLMNVEANLALMTVPSLSQAMLIGQMITSQPVDPVHVLVSFVTTSIAAGLLCWLAIWLYTRERILI